MSGIIILGAGQAGQSLAVKLRALGYEGQVTLIGAETEPPYQRPPLSKAYLLGEMPLARLYLRSDEFYAEQNIELRLGAPVDAVDAVAKTVTVNGETLSWDQLAFTTGSSPRHLPASIGGALDGVFVMRDLADADAMAPRFVEGASVLIVGGGYIGLEAAAVAAKKGLKVTLVEMSDRILQRVAAPQTSDYFRALHQDHGVDIREGTGLSHLTGEGHVSSAVLSDGSELAVDFVIVGVGITPDSDIAETAGIALENGIKTDAHGQCSVPGIWAAGDCASFPHMGQQIRLESVGNAIDQAELVAENMLGAAKTYVPKPWFWSDQYEAKLQIAGLSTGYDHIAERHDGNGVSFWYYAGETLIAVDAVNDARAYMVGKRLIEAGKSPAPEVVSDSSVVLKTLLRA
jgi:3-phenylpropionate/trans-cinnamate dioxygenase ferredoxin reductase component